MRIEIDGVAGGTTAAPDVAPRGRSPLPIVGGLFALVVAVVLVVMALPDSDDGFVGGPEATADAVAPTSTSTTSQAPATTEVSPVVDTNLSSNVQSIAAAARGWIALRSPANGFGVPGLSRSLNGMEWTPIDATFDLPEAEGSHREFSALAATDEGFAMLMTSFREPDAEGEASSVAVTRLVSDFGVAWSVDDSFARWTEVGSFAQPVAHLGDYAQFVLWKELSPQESQVAVLLRSVVVDPGLVGVACWAFTNGDVLQVEPCQGAGEPGASIRLTAADLREPERFNDLRSCVAELMEGRGPMPGTYGFITLGRDGSRRAMEDIGILLSAPALLPDGTVVVVDGGADVFADSVCSLFMDLGERLETRVTIWRPKAPEPFHLPVAAAGSSGLSSPVGAAATVSNGIRMIVDTEVWEINTSDGTVETILEMSDSGTLQSVRVLTPYGSRLIQLSRNEIVAHDLDTGEQTVLDDAVQGEWFEPLLATNEGIFVQI